jgi:phytoene dehydrogenase-like protein
MVDAWPKLEGAVLAPPGMPRHSVAVARFGMQAIRSAESLARQVFAEDRTRALLPASAPTACCRSIDAPPPRSVWCSTLAHGRLGLPRGGAQRLSHALAAHLRALGGEIVTGTVVTSVDELPPARAILCDLSPAPLLRVAGHRFPAWVRRKLERYRYGMAAFKVDWALDGLIPWRAGDCAQAGTVHLGERSRRSRT